MKINTPRQSKKLLIIASAVILLVLVGILTYPLYSGTITQLFGGQSETEQPLDTQESTDTPDIEEPATEEQIKDGEDIKKDVIDNDQAEDEPSTTVSVIITRAEKNEAGTIVQVRTLVETLTSGTCQVRATANGKVYTTTVNTQALASSSTCKGFDIPVSTLGVGTWDITITYSNNTQQGAASVKVEI